MDEHTIHEAEIVQPVGGEVAAPGNATEAPQQAEAQPDSQETSNARNLRIAKERADERAKEAEQRAMELERRVKEIEEQQNKPRYEDSDLVDRKYVDDRIRAIETEQKLKSNYPDYEKVVNENSIAQLREQNPTMALALSQINDKYSQAAAVYETMRSMGIGAEDTYGKDREKAQTNANKPRPLQSLAPQKNDSPISQANAFAEGALSEDYLAQLRKEMNQARKGY